MAAIGGTALLGTLITNVSLWMSLAKGLTLQEAYAQIGFDFSSPTELLSFGALLFSGFSGGYVAALYGSGRHFIQSLFAGAVGTTFFIAMRIGPSSPPMPGWYVPLYLASVMLSSVVGGYAYARQARIQKASSNQ
jgi:hypothetical protein